MDITSLINETAIQMGNPLLIPMIISLGLQAIGTGVGLAQGQKQKNEGKSMRLEGRRRLDKGLKGMRASIDARRQAYDNIFNQVYGVGEGSLNSFGNKGFSFSGSNPNVMFDPGKYNLTGSNATPESSGYSKRKMNPGGM